ncbi:ferredoxin--NADP reductase [Paraburkholderia fungorum]|uniref:ferredoxin--NADP reductase n=1 Tax=Paraburkholderia fungorum TaxID=134537 RepID=UPI0038BB3EDB
MSTPTSYQTRLIARTTIAEDTVAFELERPADFAFEAGQFVSLRLSDFALAGEDDGERMLSVASTPHESRLIFAMRMRDTPFKRQLAACDIGTTFLLSPAMGDFVLPDDPTTPIVMIAGGIGITPFYSMLNTLRHRAEQGLVVPPVTLVYGNRTPAAASWREALEQLTQTLANFQLVHVYGDGEAWTSSELDANPRIRGGLITADVIKEIDGWRESQYFVVGPVAMVAVMQDCLDDCGVPPGHVTIEFFAGY